MALPRSPLAPKPQEIHSVPGVRFATAATAIKYRDRDDVMLAVCPDGTSVAGVFTNSSTRSAAVLDCEAKIGGTGKGPAAFLVNAGNANAFTGKAGVASVETLTAAIAKTLDLDTARVFTASTGVIGETLPHERIVAALPDLKRSLTEGAISSAAAAIRTTDTFEKAASRQIVIDGSPVTISGIAKGSGMIAPDMATMLGFVFTDAVIGTGDLQIMLRELTNVTFNAISVDADTSTSDTVLVAATGASGVDVTDKRSFRDALHEVLHDLAMQIIRDGEGASKLMEVRVTGARSASDAKRAAMAVVNSPLVKTALAGADPNWGRIVMAIGKSGALADRDLLQITFDEQLVAEHGQIAASYHEDIGAAAFAKDNVTIGIDLGLGDAAFTAWGCDLTNGYIQINADYRS